MSGGRSPGGALAEALAAEEAALLTCVHCGFCLPACPTYVRLGDEADSPRGRLHLMRAVVEGRLDPASATFDRHLDRCLGCRACEPVCPSGVPYGHLLERARAVVREHRRPPLQVRRLLAVLERPRLSRFVWHKARLLRATGLPSLLARILPRRWALPFAMLAASAPEEWLGRPGAHPPTREGTESETVRVGLLTGCVQEGLFQRVNAATRRTLEANGYEVVEVRGQRCCGALHAHAGDLEGARALARANVETFASAGIDRLCVNAAGCGATLREYGTLLEGDPLEDEAQALAAITRDVSELLADRGPRPGAPLPGSVAYDPPCHLIHGQGVHDPVLAVLDAIPGLERRPVARAEECCGGAGVYGMTHPELGGTIGRDKVEALAASGADRIATGNPGCAMQIGGTARMHGRRLTVHHPVELLDESYRRAGIYQEDT